MRAAEASIPVCEDCCDYAYCRERPAADRWCITIAPGEAELILDPRRILRWAAGIAGIALAGFAMVVWVWWSAQ